jgi:hypothetical protein
MKLGLATPVELKTNLSRPEVISRLKGAIDEPGAFFPWFGPFGLVGRVGPDRCWFANGSFFRRNNRILRLKYDDADAGTVLRGAFEIPVLQQIPLWFLLGIGTLMSVLFVFRFATDARQWNWHGLLYSLFPIGFTLLGFAMLKFNLWLSRGSELELIELLEEILKAPATWGKDGKEGAVPSGLVIRPKARQPPLWRSDRNAQQ